MNSADERRWRPPGNHKRYYRVTFDFEGCQPIEVSALVPSLDKVNLSSAHIERIGGPSKKDLAFRKQLYFVIGAAVVASGHIETAMQRLVILTSGNREADFISVNWTWTQLFDELRKNSSEKGSPNNTVTAALDWAERNSIKKIRDKFVHASWWDYSGIGVICTRFERRTSGSTIVGTIEELTSQANSLLEFSAMLDEIVGPHWINFYLPAE